MTGKQNSFVIPSKREKMDSTNSTYTKQALTNQCLNVFFGKHVLFTLLTTWDQTLSKVYLIQNPPAGHQF